jgi:hypothetical protein
VSATFSTAKANKSKDTMRTYKLASFYDSAMTPNTITDHGMALAVSYQTYHRSLHSITDQATWALWWIE